MLKAWASGPLSVHGRADDQPTSRKISTPTTKAGSLEVDSIQSKRCTRLLVTEIAKMS